MILLVAVNGALTRTAPPKTVIGPGMVVAADISIVCVLVDFPRVNPLTVFAMFKLLGKSKVEVKLVPAGCKVREPVVVTSLVNPEPKGINVKTFPINEIFAVLLVIPVPALDPSLAPLLCMMIPRVPPSIVIDPELARMSRLDKDTPLLLPAVPVMEIFPPPVARISLGLKKLKITPMLFVETPVILIASPLALSEINTRFLSPESTLLCGSTKFIPYKSLAVPCISIAPLPEFAINFPN